MRKRRRRKNRLHIELVARQGYIRIKSAMLLAAVRADMLNPMPNPSGVKIIYDGECPFCSRFAALVSLREQFGAVELIDARAAEDPLIQALRAKYKLDEGFVVIHEGAEYHGDAAMRFLSGASGEAGGMARLLRTFFPARKSGGWFYRWLVRGRNLALKLVGRKLMGY